MGICQTIAMLVSVVLLCATSLGTWFSAANASPRIFGGEDADIEDFPYQISLESSNGHSCGGSILSPVKIVTAAHCTENRPASMFRVRAGSSWREEGGQVVTVAKKVEHPEYNSPTTVNNDIAVLILSEPLVLNEYVQTIQISEAQDVPVNTYGTVTGWGVTESGERAKRLQKVDVPKALDDVCNKYYGSTYNTSTFVCYGGERGRDACTSDSGGPLVVDGAQVGIVSYGPASCSGFMPGLYTKLNFYEDFINSVN